MYPGTHISRPYHDGQLLNNPVQEESADTAKDEETIAFWRSSTGRLRLAAGTTKRKGEVSVLLTEAEADSLGFVRN